MQKRELAQSKQIRHGILPRLLALFVFFAMMCSPLLVSCSSHEIGHSVYFGNYYFYADKSIKQIEWEILHIEDDKALVVSRYNLDLKPYHADYEEVTWETCSLRNWLNSSFINEAFSQKEQEKIVLTTLKNASNPEYGTEGGKDTQDRIFLLSVDEVEKYMTDLIKRESVSTKYAKGQGAYVNGANGSSWWALRTPGYDATCMATITTGGEISLEGDGVDSTDYALRPAMWIYLD